MHPLKTLCLFHFSTFSYIYYNIYIYSEGRTENKKSFFHKCG